MQAERGSWKSFLQRRLLLQLGGAYRRIQYKKKEHLGPWPNRQWSVQSSSSCATACPAHTVPQQHPSCAIPPRAPWAALPAARARHRGTEEPLSKGSTGEGKGRACPSQALAHRHTRGQGHSGSSIHSHLPQGTRAGCEDEEGLAAAAAVLQPPRVKSDQLSSQFHHSSPAETLRCRGGETLLSHLPTRNSPHGEASGLPLPTVENIYLYHAGPHCSP